VRLPDRATRRDVERFQPGVRRPFATVPAKVSRSRLWSLRKVLADGRDRE